MTEPAEGTVFTPNLNLAKQPTGAENWGETLNENFDKIDEAANKGAGLELLDVGISLFVDESENLRRILNGQVISSTQFSDFYTKLSGLKTTYPSIFATETEWQEELASSKLGQCGKFVIDEELGTIRLPKVVNINGCLDLLNLGKLKNETLPNHIHGSLAASNRNGNPDGGGDSGGGRAYWRYGTYYENTTSVKDNSTFADGAPVQQEAIQYFYFIQVATGSTTSANVDKEIQLNNPFFFGMSQWFDSEPNNASWLISNGSFHSGATYSDFYEWLLGKRNKNTFSVYGWGSNNVGVGMTLSVSPQVNDRFYSYQPLVDIGYVTAVSDSSITVHNKITNTTFDLTRYIPFDGTRYVVIGQDVVVLSKSELNNFDAPTEVGLNSDYTYVIDSSDITFRLPVKVKLASGNAVAGNGMTLGLVNSQGNGGLTSGASGSLAILQMNSSTYGTDFGTTASSGNMGANVSAGITLDPTKSGIETSAQGLYLYFYVGETIQDANVINAAKILTTVANIKAHACIESYDNGTDWYRIYADGRIEQGGKIVDGGSGAINYPLLKPMADTNYSVQATSWNTSFYAIGNAYSTTQVTLETRGHDYTVQQLRCYWEVKGKMALI